MVQLPIPQFSLFLSLLLGVSAAHKGMQFGRICRAAQELAKLSGRAASVAVVISGIWEAGAAVLLWNPGTRGIGALHAAVLIGIYLALIGRAFSEKRGTVDCGCSLGGGYRVLGSFEVLRNACLVALALLVAASASDPARAVSFSDLLATSAMLAVYYALDEVMGVLRTMRGVIR